MLPFQLTKDELDSVNIERKNHPDAKIRIRFQVLYFKILGYKRAEIAKLAGCSRNSVTNYVKLFNTGGLAAIRQLNYNFERHELCGQFEEVKRELTKQGVRSVAHAGEVLKHKFAYQRSSEAVRQLLHRLGLRRRKLGTFPGKPRDLDLWLKAQKQFKKKLRQLRKQARKGEIDLGFSDAAHFVYGKFSAYEWNDQARFAPSGHGRYRINVYGTYNPVTRAIHTMYNEGYVDANFMYEYLVWLRKQCYTEQDRPLHLVMDNARYQHCNFIKQTAQNLNIVLEFLPPYSPNLNLIERLWKYMKKHLAHHYCQNKQEFQKVVVELLEQIGVDKQHAKQLKSLLAFKFQEYKKEQILIC